MYSILTYDFYESHFKTKLNSDIYRTALSYIDTESHSKLHNDILYRAADSKTKMKDAREAIMALANENFVNMLQLYAELPERNV